MSLTPEQHAEERLAALLFRLARDNVAFGIIEEQVQVVERAHHHPERVEYVEQAKPMGEWARRTAKRVLSP